MMKNSSKFIFFFMMITGTLISISSNSWFGVWMGLEINLLSFIPLMIDTNNMMSTESSLKYFLTQAFASSILLSSMIIFMLLNNFSYQFEISNYSSFLIFMTTLIKCGVAPFHFWFPNVMEGTSWDMNLILMTWQKIAPLLVISYFKIFNLFYIFIFLSAYIGAIGGLNQTSLRKIMAFSSINHLSWMMAAMMFNEYLWNFYFITYSLMSLSLIYMFNNFKLFYLNQMFNLFNQNNILKFTMLMSLLSLSGLPPFLGFLPKWIVIQSLMTMNQSFLIMMMIMMSLITMYFYLRICYSAFMLNYMETNWINKSNFNLQNLLMMIMAQFLTINSLFFIIMMIYWT